MVNTGTLDDRYFEWLYSLIGVVGNENPARSHWSLAHQLYTKPFVWFVHNDDNRALDGKDLRTEFSAAYRIDADPIWMGMECSLLEMLIALSRRVAYQSYGLPGDWFWKLLENLEIRGYTDEVYDGQCAVDIDEILDTLVQRRYSREGFGGLFPLRNAKSDQRKSEIWDQMSSYLFEGEYGVNNGPNV